MPISARKWNPSPWLLTTAFTFVACSNLIACSDAPPEESSIAKALSYESKERKAAEQLESKELSVLAKQSKAQQAADAKFEAAVATLVKLPDTKPPTLAAACDQLVDAYDQFMRNLTDERTVIDWYQGRRKKLAVRRGNCLKQDSIDAAACQIHALTAAPPEVLDRGKEGGRRLLLGCAENFGGKASLVDDDEPVAQR